VDATVDPIYSAPRPGDVKDSQADISKARRILGYAPIVSFEEGLARTVAWYRDSHVTVG
jgi:nucleoside-diphosphate-sugar epimerase